MVGSSLLLHRATVARAVANHIVIIMTNNDESPLPAALRIRDFTWCISCHALFELFHSMSYIE